MKLGSPRFHKEAKVKFGKPYKPSPQPHTEESQCTFVYSKLSEAYQGTNQFDITQPMFLSLISLWNSLFVD